MVKIVTEVEARDDPLPVCNWSAIHIPGMVPVYAILKSLGMGLGTGLT